MIFHPDRELSGRKSKLALQFPQAGRHRVDLVVNLLDRGGSRLPFRLRDELAAPRLEPSQFRLETTPFAGELRGMALLNGEFHAAFSYLRVELGDRRAGCSAPAEQARTGCEDQRPQRNVGVVTRTPILMTVAGFHL